MDNGEIKSEKSSDDEMPPLEDCSDVTVIEPVDGVVLVTRCALSIQPKIDGDVEQHEHIFHTRCRINDKEFTYVFPEEVPHGLAPLRGIEHQIDLISSCPISNRPAYVTNPEETKEIQNKSKGISVDEEKVKTIREWSIPKNANEFSYKRTVHSTSSYSPFEVVYGFNPLTPLDILTLATNEHANLDEKQKADFVRELHVKVRANIEKRNDEEFDSWKNPFEDGGNDRDPTNKAKYPLRDIGGPMTRSKTKMMNQSLQNLILEIKESSEQRRINI
ncbi:hypothetical protein CR513_45350, partial [Mucuna pruriens]